MPSSQRIGKLMYGVCELYMVSNISVDRLAFLYYIFYSIDHLWSQHRRKITQLLPRPLRCWLHQFHIFFCISFLYLPRDLRREWKNWTFGNK